MSRVAVYVLCLSLCCGHNINLGLVMVKACIYIYGFFIIDQANKHNILELFSSEHMPIELELPWLLSNA